MIEDNSSNNESNIKSITQSNNDNQINQALITSDSLDVKNQTITIVGGGHVGLSFALLLANHGIASTLIEKNKYPPNISPDDDTNRVHYLDSRNTALSRRTVQIYQEIGLWDSLQSHACRIDEVQVSEQNGFGHATLRKAEEGVESFGQVMENAWLGRELLLAVQKNELITLIDGATVDAVTQDESSASITYTVSENLNAKDTEVASKKTHQLTSDLLVACDGRDSAVRALLGIDTSKYDYKQSGIVGVVTTDTPHNHVGIERFSPAGPLAVLPLTDAGGDGREPMQQGYRRSVVWVCPKGEEDRYLNDDAHFLQTLQDAFGMRAGKFIEAGKRGCYPLTKVLAKRQVVGRCIIMGNAAHTLHPVAGQGFNLCMRDAHVLANMIANQKQLKQDIGDRQLLQHYETARLKDQKRVIRFCDAVVFGFTHPSPFIKFARNLGLLMFDKIPNVKPIVATYAMGLKS